MRGFLHEKKHYDLGTAGEGAVGNKVCFYTYLERVSQPAVSINDDIADETVCHVERAMVGHLALGSDWRRARGRCLFPRGICTGMQSCRVPAQNAATVWSTPAACLATAFFRAIGRTKDEVSKK